MNAKLPESRVMNTIGAMKVDETGYAVPWAMYADAGKRLWINPMHTIHAESGGTAAMKITRLANGYEVDITRGHAADFQWEPREDRGGNYPVLKCIS